MFKVISKRYFVHHHLYPSIKPQCSQPHRTTAAVVPDMNSRRGRRKHDTSAPLRDRREALAEEGRRNLLFQPLFFPPYLPTRALQIHLGQLMSREPPRRAAPVPARSAAERSSAVHRGVSRTGETSGERRGAAGARSSRGSG